MNAHFRIDLELQNSWEGDTEFHILTPFPHWLVSSCGVPHSLWTNNGTCTDYIL